MTPIVKRKEHFTEDYRSFALHNVFVQTASTESCTKVDSFMEYQDIEYAVGVIRSAQQTLLCAADSLQHEELIHALKYIAEEKGVRVMVLLGKEEANVRSIDVLAGRCLLRTGVEQEGMLLMVDHTTLQSRGMIFLSSRFALAGKSSETNSIVLELDQQQKEDSFRSFAKLFWEYAKKEYVQQGTSRNAQKHPEGDILLNASHHMPSALPKHIHKEDFHFLCLQSNDITIRNCRSSTTMLLNQQYTSAVISEYASKTENIGLIDCIAPNVLLSESTGWVLPDRLDMKKSNWVVFLSAQQQKKIHAAFQPLIQQPQWKFHRSIQQEALVVPQQVRFAEEANMVYECLASRSHTLADSTTSSIDEFVTSKGNARTLVQNGLAWKRSCMAHEIEYSVTVHPVYKPEQAKKDELYAAWEKAQQSWNDNIAKQKNLLQKLETHKKNAKASIVSVLSRFFFTQERSAQGLFSQLDALADWDVCFQSPADRMEKNDELQSIHEEIEKRHKDMARTIDEATQKEAWEANKQELEEKMKNAQAIQAKAEGNIISIKEEMKQAEEQNLSDFSEQWQQLLNEQKPKEHEQLLSMDWEGAKQWCSRLSKKQVKEHKKLHLLVEDTIKRQKMQNSKVDTVQKDLDKAKREATAATKAFHDHGDVFVYECAAEGVELDVELGIRSKNKGFQRVQWPAEELPEQFVLWKHKKERYLTIETEEEIDAAHREAQRLQATLCVEHPHEQ